MQIRGISIFETDFISQYNRPEDYYMVGTFQNSFILPLYALLSDVFVPNDNLYG